MVNSMMSLYYKKKKQEEEDDWRYKSDYTHHAQLLDVLATSQSKLNSIGAVKIV